MSRSYREPVAKDSNSKFAKAKANKAVRKDENIISGSSFKKAYNSYNISDYSFYRPNDVILARK